MGGQEAEEEEEEEGEEEEEEAQEEEGEEGPLRGRQAPQGPAQEQGVDRGGQAECGQAEEVRQGHLQAGDALRRPVEGHRINGKTTRGQVFKALWAYIKKKASTRAAPSARSTASGTAARCSR